MDATATAAPDNSAAATPAAPPAAPPAADPFALDENALASLSPEQRASVEPIIDGWRKKAQEEITKRESSVAEKYKPLEEKASALDKLTNYAPFVQWWQAQQHQAAQGATPGQQTAIEQTKPADFATPQEWQEAMWEASQGDASKLQSIQQRMMSAWATPVVQQMTQRQQVLETQLEVKDLFERHPDAKELDKIGLDPKTNEGVSLLEMALDWAERNRKPLEEGYRLAKQWADNMTVGAQQKAMGMVTAKKQEVTAGPSTSNANMNVIEVDSPDELLKRSLEAQMSGNTTTRFVIRRK